MLPIIKYVPANREIFEIYVNDYVAVNVINQIPINFGLVGLLFLIL